MPLKCPIARAAYTKEYQKRDVYKKYQKSVYQKHRIKRIAKQKKYINEHKEERREYTQKYYQSAAGNKKVKFTRWKATGLILREGETEDEIYERYINTNKCDICSKLFMTTRERCMDHDHTTGFFRQVLCQNCNIRDRWEAKQRKDAEIVIYRFIIGKYRIN